VDVEIGRRLKLHHTIYGRVQFHLTSGSGRRLKLHHFFSFPRNGAVLKTRPLFSWGCGKELFDIKDIEQIGRRLKIAPSHI